MTHNALPVEILVDIFLYCAHADALACVRIGHVCARWRTAALNDRSLWTDVPATLGTNWLYRFFSRSGRRAVSIDWQSAHAPAYAPVLNALNTIFVPLVFWRLRNATM